MSLFDRLFARRRGETAAGDDALIASAAERAAQVVEPRLALLPDYLKRMRPALEVTIAHVREFVVGLGGAREASAAAWSRDATIRAVFVRAEDVAATISRSREVQRFFRQNPSAHEIYATLGMALTEKTVLAPALVDGVLQQDVKRTQLSFGDHRLAIVGGSEDEFRRAIGQAMFNQYLLNVVQQLAARDRQRKDLDVARSLLRARLRMLQERERPLAEAMDDNAADDPLAEVADLERQLARSDEASGALGGGIDALDRTLDLLTQTLSHPGESVSVEPRRVRLDHDNTVQTDGAAGDEIEFAWLKIASDPPRTRAAVLIRFARSDLQAGGLNIGAAERAL